MPSLGTGDFPPRNFHSRIAMLHQILACLALTAGLSAVGDPMLVNAMPVLPPQQTVYDPPPPPDPNSRQPTPRNNPGRWIVSTDYPKIAMLMQETGSTGFRLTVSKDGRVTGCKVTRSSGFARLDELTCSLITRRARFDPGLRRGEPVEGSYSNRVRWMIADSWVLRASDFGWKRPKAAVDQKARGMVQFKLSIEADGRVSHCTILRSSGFDILDRETCAQLQKLRSEVSTDAGGNLGRRRIVNTVLW